MQDAPTPPPDGPVPELRFLKILVTTLTGVMIVGLVVIIGLLVTRLQPLTAPPVVTLPDHVTLPDGAHPVAFTAGPGWHAVVTSEDEILILDPSDGTLRQRIAIKTDARAD